MIRTILGWVGVATALGSTAITAAVSSATDERAPFAKNDVNVHVAAVEGDVNVHATPSIRVLEVGPACDECSTHTFVQEAIDACEGATDLAANGIPKRDLCIAYLDCAREHDCVLANRFDESGCFCGFNDRTQGPDVGACFGTQRAARGPCVSEAQAAAESTDITDINEAWLRPDSALGRANEVLRRQLEFCSDDGAGGECFQYR